MDYNLKLILLLAIVFFIMTIIMLIFGKYYFGLYSLISTIIYGYLFYSIKNTDIDENDYK